MNLTKKEKVEFSNTPFVGFMECAVKAINPNREELIKMLNVGEDKQDDFKEREYLSEDEEGKTKLSIDFWLEEVLTKRLFNYRVTLVDKKQLNKDETKKQYVSCTGDSSWVDDESNLQSWFTHFTDKEKNEIGDKVYREAYVGEASLYTFMKAWLSGVDFRSTDANILLDWNKIMRGNLKELTDLITSEYVGTVVAMAEVRIKEDENGIKHYQGVYNKNVLPGYTMKFIRNNVTQSSPNWKSNYLVNRFVEEIQGEYGSKNVYILDTLKPYDESMSIASTDKVISADDSSY